MKQLRRFLTMMVCLSASVAMYADGVIKSDSLMRAPSTWSMQKKRMKMEMPPVRRDSIHDEHRMNHEKSMMMDRTKHEKSMMMDRMKHEKSQMMKRMTSEEYERLKSKGIEAPKK